MLIMVVVVEGQWLVKIRAILQSHPSRKAL
jgi:hypothetical protein